jgi:TrmH family RNA methyltransferase
MGLGRSLTLPAASRRSEIIVVDLLSDKNPVLKQIRRAVSRGVLTDDGYAVAEGAHLLEDARRAGTEIHVVIASESVAHKFPEARVVRERTFRELSSTQTPQGVLALVRPRKWTIDDVIPPDSVHKPALVVILDSIQEPGNAGAIARAAEAFGATGILFLKGTVNPYNPRCLRASAGSLFRLPFLTGDIDIVPPILLYAAMPRAETPVYAADFRISCGVIIGSEGHGIREELAARSAPLCIPTIGVESLNAAVAAGVLLYEASRQRAAGVEQRSSRRTRRRFTVAQQKGSK